MNLISSSLLSTLLILLTLSHPIRSASSTATTFCKCICFNNSTIIALNPPPSSTPGSHKFDIRSPHADPFYPYRPDPPVGKRDEDSEDSEGGGSTSPSRPHHKLTCADCTRAFCLDYHLPICKNAREEDVFTTCFQRDSLKDETVVVIFIFATAGLLAWAVVKPWVDRLRERNAFTGLPHHDGGGHGGMGNNANRNAGGPAGQARRAGAAANSGYRRPEADGGDEDEEDEDDAPTPTQTEQDRAGLSSASTWAASGTGSASRL